MRSLLGSSSNGSVAAAAAFVVATIAAQGPARAHHAAVEHWVGHPQPRTFLGTDMASAHFDLAGVRGSYLVMAPRADWAALDWLAVGARVPLQLLSFDSGGSESGLGDVELLSKARLWQGAHQTLTAGLGLELPTGDSGRGLGGGHYAVMPFVSSMLHLAPVMLHATVADAIAVGHTGHAGMPGMETVRYVNPHSEHELQYHGGLAYLFGGTLFVNAVLSGATILQAAERGTTLLTTGAQAGWTPAGRWRFAIGGDLPLTEQRRFDWRATAIAQVLF